jgi:hypothetical protein
MITPRKALAALLMLLTPLAYGAVSTVESTTVSLYKGTSKLGEYPSWDACQGAARTAVGKITTGTVTYSCKTEVRKVVGTFSTDPPPPPPPTCPTTKPADLTRSQTCPTGTTGSWTQTSTATAAPYPTCWIIGDFLPSSPPAGACTPIVTQPPPPPSTGALYSNDCSTRTGPEGSGNTEIKSRDGSAGVCKQSIAAGAQFFGGKFATTTLNPGDEIWVKIDHYFPSAFCAGSSTVSGDYWGATKWVRMDWGSLQRFTFELGNFGRSSCDAKGPSIYGAVPEITADYAAPYNYEYASKVSFPRNKWSAWQAHIKIGTTRATSMVEMWIDDQYLGKLTPGSATAPGRGGAVDWYIGDYWNGGSLQPNVWYLDNFQITKTPNAKDSGGRAYIAP